MPGIERHADSIDFTCRVCGKLCNCAPDPPDRAVCEDHCPDHEYEYDRGECDRFCKTCGKRADPDWGRCDDDWF